MKESYCSFDDLDFNATGFDFGKIENVVNQIELVVARLKSELEGLSLVVSEFRI